jgi:hypothetical protein
MVFEYLNLVGYHVTCNTQTSVPDPYQMDPEFMASGFESGSLIF